MTKQRVFIIIFVAVAVIAMAIYFVFDPSDTGNLFPKCVFRVFTGYQCPGCGSQRAFHALLHGDLCGAMRYNAALPIGGLLMVIYLVAEWKRMSWPRFYAAMNNRWMGYGILISLLAWWVLRNVFEI